MSGREVLMELLKRNQKRCIVMDRQSVVTILSLSDFMGALVGEQVGI
jgi:hypothetical protein